MKLRPSLEIVMTIMAFAIAVAFVGLCLAYIIGTLGDAPLVGAFALVKKDAVNQIPFPKMSGQGLITPVGVEG